MGQAKRLSNLTPSPSGQSHTLKRLTSNREAIFCCTSSSVGQSKVNKHQGCFIKLDLKKYIDGRKKHQDKKLKSLSLHHVEDA